MDKEKTIDEKEQEDESFVDEKEQEDEKQDEFEDQVEDDLLSDGKNADELNKELVNEDKEDNLLGGLEIESSSDIFIPDKLVDQVIGQERARKIVKKAAKQHRHVMMIGSPGTGKSMLSKSMTELMSKEELTDILVYPNPDDDNNPKIRQVPAGKGKKIIEAHKSEADQKDSARNFIVLLIVAFIIIYSIVTSASLLFGIIAAAVIYFLFKYMSNDAESNIPNLLIDNSDREKANFEDATGAHDGALLGDVRHDPFQSGGMETPAHNRVEAGAIHESNNGVLFIDEINTLDVRSQQKLMTAIQEGEFHITGQSERSSGAMVQTEPIPTNFTLVAAGNMDAIENMHPALRDRIEGYGYEVYMDDKIKDTPENRRKFARFVAQEVERDGNIPHFSPDGISEIILQAKRKAGEDNKLTLKLRNLGGLIRSAGDIARDENAEKVRREHVLDAKKLSRSIEQQYVNEKVERKKKYAIGTGAESRVGKVNGLAVMGDDSGIVLPVMGKVSKSQNSGKIIATGKLQDIAEEAVDNVSAIIKDLGADLSKKDIHVQFVQTYEGVQGDSASVTVATAIISAIKEIPIKQNIAMTGSLSIRGDVLPVGGVTHKVEAAAKQDIDKVLIPKANEDDVMVESEYEDQIEVIPVKHINEVLSVALVDDEKGKYQKLIDKISSLANAPKVSEITSKNADIR